MRCKRSEPMQLDIFESDEELFETESDEDNETYENVVQELSTEQRNDTGGEREQPANSVNRQIFTQSEIDDSYELQSIIGANHFNGQMHFLVKWTHSDRLEFVQSRLLNVKFPAQVIAFYEEHMHFEPRND